MRKFEEDQLSLWEELGVLLERRREEMCLSIDYCAGMCGLSNSTYEELETRCDEFFVDISLGTARRITAILNLDLFEIIEKFWGRPIELLRPQSPFDYYRRTEVLSKAKKKNGISDERFEDETGWLVTVIADLERTPDYIESMPIYALISIAETLALDAGALIGVPPTR